MLKRTGINTAKSKRTAERTVEKAERKESQGVNSPHKPTRERDNSKRRRRGKEGAPNPSNPWESISHSLPPLKGKRKRKKRPPNNREACPPTLVDICRHLLSNCAPWYGAAGKGPCVCLSLIVPVLFFLFYESYAAPERQLAGDTGAAWNCLPAQIKQPTRLNLQLVRPTIEQQSLSRWRPPSWGKTETHRKGHQK